MEIFELLAIHPFSSIEELDRAYQVAKDKIDPMKQADLDALDDAFHQAREILTQKEKLLELVKSMDDLIYLLKKFPEHGYEIIAYLDNDTCQFGMNQVLNAFSRSALAVSALSNPQQGLFAGLLSATRQFVKEGMMQVKQFSPLARLVLSGESNINFNALMTSIEPSLVLYIGFRLCEYSELGKFIVAFQKNTGHPDILSAGMEFFSGSNVSFKSLASSFWSKSAYERARHLLAYVQSMYKMECEIYAMLQSKDPKTQSAVVALFSALKYAMIIDMQHVNIHTLQRNQVMLPDFYQCIESRYHELQTLGASDILDRLKETLPFAFKVHLSNALMICDKPLPLLGQKHESLVDAFSGFHLELEDSDEAFYDCNTDSSIANDYIEIQINPFKADSEGLLLLQVFAFIDKTLDNYQQVADFAQNAGMVSKGLYLSKIRLALLPIYTGLTILKEEGAGTADVPDYLENHRIKIQAYCHLLQYVTNIETGRLSGYATKITEPLDQKASIRLTGTRTHESLIDLFRKQYPFCFDENPKTKKDFLKYIDQRRSPEFIIETLGLGLDNMLVETQLPSPTAIVKESFGKIAVQLPSMRALAEGWFEGLGAWLGRAAESLRERFENGVGSNPNPNPNPK